MKSRLFIFYFLISGLVNGYTPDARSILTRTQCIKKTDVIPLFNGMLSEKNSKNVDHRFISVDLNDGSFKYFLKNLSPEKFKNPEQNLKNLERLKTIQKVDFGFYSQILSCNVKDPKARTERLAKYLEDKGVDLSIVDHTIKENYPVYVIGAKGDQPQKAQVWISKKNFNLVFDNTSGQVDLSRYQKIRFKNLYFPQIITKISESNTIRFSISQS